jgi:hypothetical protein
MGWAAASGQASIDATGALVHTAMRIIAADAFAGGSGVEHRFELPLTTLIPGDYLLRFDTRVQRTSGSHAI